MTDVQSREEVIDPDEWHRPATYWFWHRLPTFAEIVAQIHQMHAGGFRSFQIQARLSYPRDGYLDTDYMEACRVAVETAATLGMKIGIYDEYNWQTGHAGGLSVAGHDSLRERQLFWTTIDTRMTGRSGTISDIISASEELGTAAMAWHYDGASPRWADWRVEHVIAESGNHSVLDEAPTAVVIGGELGARVDLFDEHIIAHCARVTVLVSARCATSRLINPLDRAAIERFTEVGLDPFRECFGQHFGRTIDYVFFDQPHAVFYEWAERVGDVHSAMPYDGNVDAVLRERFGDQLRTVLHAVIHGRSVQQLALRAAFYECFSAFAMDVYLGTLRDWAHRYGLRQSGHEVLSHVGSWTPGSAFDTWDLRLNFGLDHFGVDRYRDITAVDAQDAISQLSPLLGDSVARSSGRHGTLVEQYFMTPPEGGAPFSGDWGLTLADLRATAVRHHLHGMRQMIFHGFYQTDGHGDSNEALVNPRFDFPPGVNFEPWFEPHHADYAIESARLSAFLDGVRDTPRVAMVWPLRTIWTDGMQCEATASFGQWGKMLTELDVDFDVIDERQLESTEDDRFDLPRYHAIVFCAIRTLRSRATVRTCRRAVELGSTIVQAGTAPSVYQEGDQTLLDDWYTLEPVVVDADPSADFINDLVSESCPPFHIRSGRVRSRFGQVGDDTRLALFADADPARVQIDTPHGVVVESWDALSGEITQLPAADSVSIDLRPGDLRMLVLTDHSDAPMSPPETEYGDAVELDTDWSLLLAGKETPVSVRSGWHTDFPHTIGEGHYRTHWRPRKVVDHLLELPLVAGSVRVLVDETEIGRRGWPPFTFTLPADTLCAEGVRLTIAVSSPAANHYYAATGLRARPEPTGLLTPPLIRPALQGASLVRVRHTGR